MQAVILAAGRGKRMGALTEDTPKPMLTVLGRNLLEHKMDALPPEIDEVIFIVGYHEDKIRNHFGNSWKGRKISYVEQKELLGTGHAVHMAKSLIKGPFLVLMGDDIYDFNFLQEMVRYRWALGVIKVKEPKTGAQVLFDKSGKLLDIIENQKLEVGMFDNVGAYVLEKEFFEVPLEKKAPDSEEFGLPQTLLKLAYMVSIIIVEAKEWKQITLPEDLKKAEEDPEQENIPEF